MKKLLFYSLFIFVIISCSTSDDGEIDTTILPTKITHKLRFFNNYIFTRTYQYDGNKITSIISSSGDKLEYFYYGNLITTVNYFDEKNSLNATIKIDYEKNRIKTLTRKYYDEGRDLIFDYTWINDNQVRIKNNRYLLPEATAYTDVFLSNGNIIKTIRYVKSTGYEMEESRSYTYDSYSFPLKNVEGFSKIITSELDAAPLIAYTQSNNLLKYTHKQITTENGQTQETSNYTEEQNSNFSYNANGFPTKYFNHNDEDEIFIEYNR